MDERTRLYYEEHAAELAARYESARGGVEKYFPMAFEPGARVLDIGAGGGGNLATLIAEGHAAYGIEPVEAFHRVALARHPELRARLFRGALPGDLPSLESLGGAFDGILCTAVLQHLPRAQLFEAAYALKALLRDGGRALLSVPATRPGIDAGRRDEGGRLYSRLVPDELELLFERIGFFRIGRWVDDDALGRAGHSWVTLLFELRHAGSHRPLDLVESVLSQREPKVATYKLALVRALVDIALTQPRTARWTDDGRVGIPIRAVAERWIAYYWPLFASSEFLPQMNGEQRAREHRLAFTRPLQALIREYPGASSLARFDMDRRHDELSGRTRKIHRALLAKLAGTIRSGPVTHAGSASGAGSLVGHRRGEILVGGPLWRELSLTGYWIRDALILRWGEKVAGLSGNEVSAAVAVAALLEGPDAEHETAEARAIYGRLAGLECAWTGRRLHPEDYAVDHVLPYSLWRNNDLWNLLPAAPAVNRQKLDRLPTRELLARRRPTIFRYWQVCAEARPGRFAREAGAQVGARGPTLPDLFDALVESVEVTALQRGVARWTVP